MANPSTSVQDDVRAGFKKLTVADPGEGPGGASPPSPLFLDQTEARRAEKDRPPYLKVWIRHCI